jgi:hypothetical protein
MIQRTSSFAVMYVLGAQSGNRVPPYLSRFTPAFRRGVTIGSSLFPFSGLGELGFCARRSGDYGSWINAGDRFVGLKFMINGKAHYGWARLKVENVPGATAPTCALRVLLSGYAYETVPNMSIRTGQTKGPDEVTLNDVDPQSTVEGPTLGMLARGSQGLVVWRNEGEVVTDGASPTGGAQ